MTIAQPTRSLAQIKRGVRHRKDYGNLDSLARSIDDKGLLQPIAITPNDVLIAGERRMLAWPKTRFHNQPIPVHVVSLDDIVRGEWAENTDRKDLTLSEAVAIKRLIEPDLKAKARERQGVRTDLRGNSPKVDAGRAADKVAKFVGKDRRTLDKAEAVVAAAEAEPERYSRLVEAMDRSGRANGPFRRLQVMKQSEALRASPPPMPMRGPYCCLVIDFPWPHEPGDEDPAGRGRATRPYPAMSIGKGRALPVASILANDVVLWMWVTNFHMRHAYELLDTWGLTATPTILTWVKDKMGRGQVLRDKTEHCIVATRGKPVFHLTNETTELRAPRRENSGKPDEFYAVVEKLCPAPIYAELFSRGGRGPNWDCHGDEIGKFPVTLTEHAPVSSPLGPLVRSVDVPDLPTFLRRGHPDCVVGVSK
jgi:N6-adenosine-specific RNA methylase IME4